MGAIFLIPGFLALLVVGRVFGTLRMLASTLSERTNVNTIVGGILPDVVTNAVMILVCLLAGLIVRSVSSRKMRTDPELVLLGSLPSYAFVKSLGQNLQHQSRDVASSLRPVVVKSGGTREVSFGTHDIEHGTVNPCLPGAGNPGAGSAVFVRVVPVHELRIFIRQASVGTTF